MRGLKNDLDGVLLERYFVTPGSTRKIGSIHVDDEDLKEIFQTKDLEAAVAAFKQRLPGSLLRDYLSGDISLASPGGQAPRYVSILLFLCWMQTSKTRQGTDEQAGERNFRRMLTSHMGARVAGATMVGLDQMWEHLQRYLAENFDVELDLPAKDSYVLIGRTLKLAFPTWRARDALRKIRDALPDRLLLEPRHVANAFRASSHVLRGSAHSLEYNFRHFDQVQLHGGQEYQDTPFWRAWYDVVTLKTKLEWLEVREEEYGEHALYRVNPLGESLRITAPKEACEYLSREIRDAVRSGIVALEDLGFGRFRSVFGRKERHAAWMVQRRMLDEIPAEIVKSVSALTSDWHVVHLRPTAASLQERTSDVAVGWHEGIRVGSAFLARGPIAPRFHFGGGRPPSVHLAGRLIEMNVDGGELAFPHRHYTGTATARLPTSSHDVRLVPCANETLELMRQPFDPERHISEDEFYCDTAPEVEADVAPWLGERHAPCEEIVAIGEALYARAARTLSLGEAYGIVSQGLSGLQDRPTAWDVIRVFIDAGWFDGVLLRSFPARSLVMRRLGVERVGEFDARISGPTTVMLTRRVMASAGKAGATVETFGGISQWSLPRLLVRCKTEAIRQNFLIRLGAPTIDPRKHAESAVDQGRAGTHGYRVIDRLVEGRGFFVAPRGEADGLFRMERQAERNPNIYNSIVSGRPDRAFRSPSIAMLFHQIRKNEGPVFAYRDGMLTAASVRTYLPSAWARWLSDVTLANPGIVRSGAAWGVAYAATDRSAKAVADLVPVRMGGTEAADEEWVEMFLGSASRRGRAIFEPSTARIRVGRTYFEESYA